MNLSFGDKIYVYHWIYLISSCFLFNVPSFGLLRYTKMLNRIVYAIVYDIAVGQLCIFYILKKTGLQFVNSLICYTLSLIRCKRFAFLRDTQLWLLLYTTEL